MEALEQRALLASSLVADLNPLTFGSDPRWFATLGSATYFFANSTPAPGAAAPTSAALWRTDGTPAGTTVVRDGFAPPRQNVNTTAGLTAAAGRLIFTAWTPEHGEEPWVSDGTPAGTRLLADLAPGAFTDGQGIGSGPHSYAGVGDQIFFSAQVAGDRELWVTDGTAENTRRVADLRQGDSSHPRGFYAADGFVYVFASHNDLSGTSLWRSDGTEAGTVRLRPFTSTGAATLTGNTLLFAAIDESGAVGNELWKSDGTPQGTVLVKDIHPGTAHSRPGGLVRVGDFVYFEADAIGTFHFLTRGLWKTDGTAAGTVLVADRAPGSTTTLNPAYVADLEGVAVFSGIHTAGFRSVFRTDGTAAGTVALTGAGVSYDTPNYGIAFNVAGGRAYFRGADAAHGSELWSTDGTPEGTGMVRDVFPGPGPGIDVSAWRRPVALGGRLVFAAGDGATTNEPWITDGTAAGTFRLADVNAAPQSSQFDRPVMRLNDREFVFGANGRVYRSDGTAAGTLPLADLSLSIFYSGDPPALSNGVVNGVAVFAARPAAPLGQPAVRDSYLYRSDGTPEGTYRLGEFNLNPNGSPFPSVASNFVTAGGFVYFAAFDAANGMKLWRTDGTRAGTTVVVSSPPGGAGTVGSGGTRTIAVVGDAVYFKGPDNRLFKTDGTEAGTELLAAPNGPVALDELAAVGDRLFFKASADGRPTALWTSDGTPAGTVPVGGDVTVSGPIFAWGGAAYFRGARVGGDAGLFRSDGTDAGTYSLGPAGLLPDQFTAFGDHLYFVDNLERLWKTDGTAAGTVPLPDTSPAGPGQVGPLAVAGGALYFSAADATRGDELWVTDGTDAGTVLVEDVLPGPAGSSPERLTAVGGSLYFTAFDPTHGTELRRLAPPPRVVARHVAHGDGNPSPGKRPLLPGGSATAENYTNDSRGVGGLLVDVAGLPAGATPSASDVILHVGNGTTWAPLAAAPTVTLRRGDGAGGSDRVAIALPDYAARNAWLRVTLRGGPGTGLARDDVFYVGNLVGDTGGGGTPVVNAIDLARTRLNVGRTTPAALAASDFNRDGRVNAVDVGIVRVNQRRTLPLFTAPVAAAPAVAATTGARIIPPPSGRTPVPDRRSVWELVDGGGRTVA